MTYKTANEPPYENFDSLVAIKHLFNWYTDYESKRISMYAVMEVLRDYYYLHHTGKNYEEWSTQMQILVQNKQIIP